MRDPRVVCGREKWEKKKINRSFARGENWVPPCMALKKKKKLETIYQEDRNHKYMCIK